MINILHEDYKILKNGKKGKQASDLGPEVLNQQDFISKQNDVSRFVDLCVSSGSGRRQQFYNPSQR